jgi:hypothetical protein
MGFSGDDFEDMHLHRVPIENAVIAAALHAVGPRPLQLQEGEPVNVELEIPGPDGTTRMLARAVVMCADGNTECWAAFRALPIEEQESWSPGHFLRGCTCQAECRCKTRKGQQ